MIRRESENLEAYLKTLIQKKTKRRTNSAKDQKHYIDNLDEKRHFSETRIKTFAFNDKEELFLNQNLTNGYSNSNKKLKISFDNNIAYYNNSSQKFFSELDLPSKKPQTIIPLANNSIQSMNSLPMNNCIKSSFSNHLLNCNKKKSIFYHDNGYQNNSNNLKNNICFVNYDNLYSDKRINHEIFNDNNPPNIDLLKIIPESNNGKTQVKNDEKVVIDTFSDSSNIFLSKLKSMNFSNKKFTFDSKSINNQFSKKLLLDLNNNTNLDFNPNKKSKFHSNENLQNVNLFIRNDKKLNFSNAIHKDLINEFEKNHNVENLNIKSDKQSNLIVSNTNRNFYQDLKFKNNKIQKSQDRSYVSPINVNINNKSNKDFKKNTKKSINSNKIYKTMMNRSNLSSESVTRGENRDDDEYDLKNNQQYVNLEQMKTGLKRNSKNNLLITSNNFYNANFNKAFNHQFTQYNINNNCINCSKINPGFINPMMKNNMCSNACSCCLFYNKRSLYDYYNIPNQDQFSPFDFDNTFKINKSPVKLNIKKDKLTEQEKKLEIIAESPARKNYYKKLLDNIKIINQKNNMDLNLDFILKKENNQEQNNNKNEQSESHCSSFDLEFYANKDEESLKSYINDENLPENSFSNFDLNDKNLNNKEENMNIFSNKSLANSKTKKNFSKSKITDKKTKSLKAKHVLFEQEDENEEIYKIIKTNKTNSDLLLLNENKTFKKSNLNLEENQNLSTSKVLEKVFSKKAKTKNSLRSTRSIKKRKTDKRKLILLHNIYDSISDLEDNSVEIRDRFIINENSMVKFFWDILVLLLILYSATVEVFMLTFQPDDRKSFYFKFEVLCDYVFFIDLVLNFFTPYYEDSKSIANLNLIALNYLKKWLVFDLISSIPINFILLIFDYKTNLNQNFTSMTFRNLDFQFSPNFNFTNSINYTTNQNFDHNKNFGITTNLSSSYILNNNNLVERMLFTTFQSQPISLMDYYFSKDFIFLFLRWLRLLRVVKLLKNDKKAQIFHDIIINKDTKINKISKLVFLFFLVMHISSCLWCYLGILVPEKNEYRSWLKKLGYEQNDYFDIYIASLYFNVVTFFTVGYGDILSYSMTERVYNCFILIVGNLLYSFGISSLSSLFINLTEFENKKKDRLQVLDKIDKRHKLPRQLYNKIKNAIKKSLLDGEGSEKFELLDSLPYGLRREVILSMHQKGISKIKFFQCEEREFIVFVMPLLRINILNKEETLITIGSVVEEMNIVNKGVLIVCLDKLFENIDIAQILPSNHFGDVLIYLNEKCPYLIKCQSKTCEILTLMKSDYNKVKISFNKIILKILKISCDFLEKLEKNKQVVICLYDEGVSFKEVKKIINRLYYFFVDLNFEFIFYENEYNPYKTIDHRITNNFPTIQQEIKSMFSVEDFILQNDIRLILKFINTNMKKEDFEEIFLNSLIDDSSNRQTKNYNVNGDMALYDNSDGDGNIMNTWAFKRLTKKISYFVDNETQKKPNDNMNSSFYIKNNYVSMQTDKKETKKGLVQKNEIEKFKNVNQENYFDTKKRNENIKLMNQSSNMKYLNTKSSLKDSPIQQRNKRLNKDEFNFYFNNRLQNQIKSTEKKLEHFLNKTSSDSEKSEKNISLNNKSNKSLKNLEIKLYKSNTYVENLEIIDEETNLKKKLKHMYSNKINQLEKLKTGKKSVNIILGLDESESCGNDFDHLDKKDIDFEERKTNEDNFIFKNNKEKNYFSDANSNIKNSDINKTISKLLDENDEGKLKRNNLKNKKNQFLEILNVKNKSTLLNQVYNEKRIKKDSSPDKASFTDKNEKMKRENISLKSSDLINNMFFPNFAQDINKIDENKNKNNNVTHQDRFHIIKESQFDLNETLKTIENEDESKRNLLNDLEKPALIKFKSKEKINRAYLIEDYKNTSKQSVNLGSSLNIENKRENIFNDESEKEANLKKDYSSVKNNQLNKKENYKKAVRASLPNVFQSKSDLILINQNFLNKKDENRIPNQKDSFIQKDVKINSFLEKLKIKKNANVRPYRKSKLLEKISNFNLKEINSSIINKQNSKSLRFKNDNNPSFNMNNQSFSYPINENLANNIYAHPNNFTYEKPSCNTGIFVCNSCGKINENVQNQINFANNYNYYLGSNCTNEVSHMNHRYVGCAFTNCCIFNKTKLNFEIIKNYSIEFYAGKFHENTKKYLNYPKNEAKNDAGAKNILKKKNIKSDNDIIKKKSLNVKNSNTDKRCIIKSISEISNGNNNKIMNDSSRLNRNEIYQQNRKIIKKLDNILSYFSIVDNGNKSSSFLANSDSNSNKCDIIIEDFHEE